MPRGTLSQTTPILAVSETCRHCQSLAVLHSYYCCQHESAIRKLYDHHANSLRRCESSFQGIYNPLICFQCISSAQQPIIPSHRAITLSILSQHKLPKYRQKPFHIQARLPSSIFGKLNFLKDNLTRALEYHLKAPRVADILRLSPCRIRKGTQNRGAGTTGFAQIQREAPMTPLLVLPRFWNVEGAIYHTGHLVLDVGYCAPQDCRPGSTRKTRKTSQTSQTIVSHALIQ